jgi:hypothetical protein
MFAGDKGESTITSTCTTTSPTTSSCAGTFTSSITTVPEPGSFALVLTGIGFLPLMRRRLARGPVKRITHNYIPYARPRNAFQSESANPSYNDPCPRGGILINGERPVRHQLFFLVGSSDLSPISALHFRLNQHRIGSWRNNPH